MSTQEPIDGDLSSRFASVLPKDRQFTIHHLSTAPYKTDALFSAPPNERPDRTFCETHFLTVSVQVPENANGTNNLTNTKSREVMVLGLEIYIYTTAHSSILFVSKADSTGYLSLLELPKGTPSPIKEVCGTFISYLVEKRARKNIQFVVSLFARSQSQYLFPGSVDNKNKHILDDRNLIKWWCRVLNPLIESPPHNISKEARGYLVVPGLDTYETRAFIPRPSLSSWSLTHPLEEISHYTREFDWVPPRCLIPRYPDDPKSRFRDELDEEAAKSGAMRNLGSWKSVQTLDMFWEMMAFRQECSSGRMTGFAWVVFDEKASISSTSALGSTSTSTSASASVSTPTPATATATAQQPPETPKKQQRTVDITPNTTPRKLFTSRGKEIDQTKVKPEKSKKRGKGQKKKIKLKGLIKTRPPRSKTEQRNYLLDTPQSTAYYFWPLEARGERIVSENSYKRIMELLLHLDFATLDKACGSTRRWISEVGLGSSWGYKIVGTHETTTPTATAIDDATPTVNNLSGMVKRKRPDAETNGVNVLGAGLIKKKPKTDA